MMVPSDMRPATATDLKAIVRLLDVAFAPSQLESQLVESLQRNSRQIHQWIVEDEGVLVAYICYSRAYRDGHSIGFHVAPLAVDPAHQRRGIGSRLLRDTLRLRPIVDASVFVLGKPSFYSRFGFMRVEQPVCPFEPSNEHFLALRYGSEASFQVGYEPEFLIGDPGDTPTGGDAGRALNVFVYGSLLFDEVVECLTGKVFSAEAASLTDHARYAIEQEGRIAKGPAIVYEPGQRVNGRLLRNVDEGTLRLLDWFECGDADPPRYERVQLSVSIRTGESVPAEAYRARDELRPFLHGKWSKHEFRTRHLEFYTKEWIPRLLRRRTG